MAKRTLADPADTLGESRARVLELPRLADEPLGVRELAERAGLHPNTVRFHLDGLAEAGLIERATEDRAHPGRPRMVYRAVPAAPVNGTRSYRLLAEMLTGMISGMLPEPERAADEAGRAWGRYLTERPAPFERVAPEEALSRLVGVLDEIGFAPDAERDGRSATIRLRNCPFREVAGRHREVICSLHLGLMRGVLEEMRTSLAADRLEPMVEPGLCLAHLTARSDT